MVVKMDESEPMTIFLLHNLASLQIFVIVQCGFLKIPSFAAVKVILNLELNSVEFEMNLNVFNKGMYNFDTSGRHNFLSAPPPIIVGCLCYHQNHQQQ